MKLVFGREEKEKLDLEEELKDDFSTLEIP